MSCFPGQMNEYKNLALDRFDGNNLKCTAFFLSHCHKDHMVGLNARAFYEHLKSRDGIYLYCTEVSRLLLSADEDYCHLEKYIRVLDVGIPRHVCIHGSKEKEDAFVCVTPISAGHCLGSVMFLFEGSEGNVLYTGDFRWEVNQAARITELRTGDSFKDLKALYVDTTFCVPEAIHIPSRNECVEAAFTLISSWLAKGLCNAVSISCPARFGHEHLLLELAKRLKTKVHVPEWKVAIYERIPELQGYFTDDASDTLLHCCSTRSGFTKTSVLPCGYRLSSGERMKLLNIRPSTMWFTSAKNKSEPADLVVAPAQQRGMHRVCYSMHSSYSEIRDLVSFIKPKRVYPNVLPASDMDMNTVQKRLERFIDHPNKFRLRVTRDVDVLQPLGTLRKMPQTTLRFIKGDSFESGSDDLIFSSQELSPCKKTSAQPKAMTIGPSPGNERQSPRGMQTSPDHPVRDVSLESQSSYSGSAKGQDDEMDLFSDEEQDGNDNEMEENKAEESLRLYVSGESETEESDHEGDKDDEGLAVDSRRHKTFDLAGNRLDSVDVFKTDQGNRRGHEDEDTEDNLNTDIVKTEVKENCEKSSEGKEAEHPDHLEKVKNECCDDNDVIPNSQDTAVTNDHLLHKKCSIIGPEDNQYRNLPREQRLTLSNSSDLSNDEKQIFSQHKDHFSSLDRIDPHDLKCNDECICLDASSITTHLVSQGDDLDKDCEIIEDYQDGVKRKQAQNSDVVVLNTSSSENSQDDETKLQTCHDKPLTVEDTISCSGVSGVQNSSNDVEEKYSTISTAIDVEENKVCNKDAKCVEFLYEEKTVSQIMSGKTGWLSKSSGTKSHACYSPSMSQGAKKTLNTSDALHKRKIEAVEDIDVSWCLKSRKQSNKFNSSEKSKPCNLLEKQGHNTSKQDDVVDLTLEDSDPL